MYYQNVRSIVSKLNILIPNLIASAFDIIALSETWLSLSVLNSELNFNNYIIYRSDRSSLNSVYKRGGGVLVAVRSHLKSKMLNVTVNCIEQVFVQIQMGSNLFIICCIYIPPTSPLILYEQFFLSINELYLSNPKAKFILLGDFNLPSLDWSLYSLPLICNSQIDSYFVSMLSHYNFNQFNLVRNHNITILDLALSNVHITVTNDPDPLLPIDIHHPALNISLNCDHYDFLIAKHDLIYDYYNCDYIKIVKSIGDSLSTLSLNSYNIDETVEQFYSILYKSINNYVPMKFIYNTSYPVWYSKLLKSLIKDKKIAHLIYKQSNNVSDYINFSRLRAKCKKQAKLDHKNYISKVQSSIKNNPKYFWKFINMLTHTDALPCSLPLDATVADNGTDIVELFGKYFSDAYCTPQSSSSPSSIFDNSNSNSTLNLNYITLTELDVLNMISDLKLSSTTGPDDIPTIFIYNCRFILAPVLTSIFNLSLSKGIFPSLWKTSFISPILKKGNPSLISNYRPVSKLSSIPKLFSRLISSKLTHFCSSFLVNNQFGFMPKRSACNNLTIAKNIILHSFDSNAQTDIIYTDFSKAFDQVNHLILFNKLQSFGFSGSLLNWFKSFLSDRFQIVKHLKFKSTCFPVPSGVPQ